MANRLNKWKESLSRTRKSTFGRFSQIIGTSDIKPETWDDLEEFFIQADLGLNTSGKLIDSLKEITTREGLTKHSELREAIKDQFLDILPETSELSYDPAPNIILIVGVNGSGKTTTIGKLGNMFLSQNKSVLFGAADTFRAAAVEQLNAWGARIGVPVISGQPGGDPGAVAYDTVQSAISRRIDIAMIDTAGRLHTRSNLMEELIKVNKVVGKALPGAPHHVWLVMDATTGQNALHQARAFKKSVNVSGVILAKLDSSSRGGMAFAIQNELDLPVLFAGLGEGIDDLEVFDRHAFVLGLLDDFLT